MEPKKINKVQNLQITSRPPILAADGNSIFITDQGYGDLTFIQVLSRDETTIKAQGVASVRLSFDQLKALNASLTQALKDHEEKMSKIAQSGEKKEAKSKG